MSELARDDLTLCTDGDLKLNFMLQQACKYSGVEHKFLIGPRGPVVVLHASQVKRLITEINEYAESSAVLAAELNSLLIGESRAEEAQEG